MNHSDQDKLWRELVSDDALEKLRASSLAEGLSAQKSRRRHRQILSGAGTACAMLILMAIIFHRRATNSMVAPSSNEIARSSTSQGPQESGIKTITDQELLALFPHRTPALIGAPGDQQLIFGDSAK